MIQWFIIAGFSAGFSLVFATNAGARSTEYTKLLAKNSATYLQNLTGDDGDSEKNHWDKLYKKSKGYVFGTEPAAFLVKNLNLLPVGRALDIAMGEGRHAVFLAKKGFNVDGVDFSDVAVRKAKRLARDNKVQINTITADLTKYQIKPESYDAILVFYYLQRSLVSQIVRGLKPGGVLMFESHTVEQLKNDKKQNRQYLLEKNELKSLFKDLEILKYSETDNGIDAIASLIARKKSK